jgi:hypothetical protein
MKRQIGLVAALWIVLSACGSSEDTNNASDADTANEDKTQGQSEPVDDRACKADSDCDVDSCKTGSTCKNGVCRAGTTERDCNDNNPCTDDSCDPKLGCRNQNNTASCDDENDCTEGDQCRSGVCRGTKERDCSAQDDACNQGVCDPEDGSCKKRPAAEGASCEADSCNKAATCKAGECKGDNACGPNAKACTTGSGGAPNSCTCKDGFRAADGQCIPENDECASNPCGENADCFDPSNDADNVTCTCKAGFSGDARKGCTAKNPCANNPCGEGRGTCSATDGDQHSCACSAGFREVAGQCVCDLQGTFAAHYEVNLSWKGISGIEDGTGQTESWQIMRQNYEPSGDLKVEIINCGETTVELCGTGVQLAGIPPEAYSQYVPAVSWGASTAPTTLLEFNVSAALPGSAFKTPRYAILNGISLTDPLGAWPAKRQDIAGGTDFDGSATNGAQWIDGDQDSLFGVTTIEVGPNGVTPFVLAPITAYPEVSAVCPRSNPSAPRLQYNYVPGLDGLTPRRVKRASSANRTISELDGTLESCDVITGNVKGPDNGHTQLDARVGSCVRADGNSEVACSSALIDFLDSAKAPSAIDSQTFNMKRVDATTTCEQVRTMTF